VALIFSFRFCRIFKDKHTVVSIFVMFDLSFCLSSHYIFLWSKWDIPTAFSLSWDLFCWSKTYFSSFRGFIKNPTSTYVKWWSLMKLSLVTEGTVAAILYICIGISHSFGSIYPILLEWGTFKLIIGCLYCIYTFVNCFCCTIPRG
jgi:hypothetical protein